jgi:hypothetical protein
MRITTARRVTAHTEESQREPTWAVKITATQSPVLLIAAAGAPGRHRKIRPLIDPPFELPTCQLACVVYRMLLIVSANAPSMS